MQMKTTSSPQVAQDTMVFALAKSMRHRPYDATQDDFLHIIRSQEMTATFNAINDALAAGNNAEVDRLKKGLPIATYQARFDSGATRSNASALPSGLVMVDLDGVDDPWAVYSEKIAPHQDECHIKAVHKSVRGHGLHIVAMCPPGCQTIAECQQWLADRLGLEFDAVCKDFARCSYLVPFDYFYFLDNSIFTAQPLNVLVNAAYGKGTKGVKKTDDECPMTSETTVATAADGTLFPEMLREYKGIPLTDIARRYLINTGGEPVEGERNARLFQTAIALRYITDFNAEILFANLPHYGLPDTEVRQLIASAVNSERQRRIPKELTYVIRQLTEEKQMDEDETTDTKSKKKGVFARLVVSNDCIKDELLPPLFRQLVRSAPDDFKAATYMALLPLLGTLASRLRATYFDGVTHSPSFQVEVEAPMASGKSFVTRLFNLTMSPLLKSDAENRRKESEYKRKVSKAKNAKEQPEVETYPVRILPGTASITQILRRMSNADGAHVLAFTDEIRIVLDSYSRGAYGNLRALMRNAFDNAMFGQDFAGIDADNYYLPVFFNSLHAGTPAEYAKFYNNTEDGTVSRVLFVTVPDQFGKAFQQWKKLNKTDKKDVERCIDLLNTTTMDGNNVRPQTINLKNFDFMARWAKKWCLAQQKVAVEAENRDLDTFMRRSAVVGFRAAMIVWYLLGQKPTKQNKDMTMQNGQWVADYMLSQLMRRYETTVTSNTIPFFGLWTRLPQQFTLPQAEALLAELSYNSTASLIIHKWKKKELVTKDRNGIFHKSNT